jgi:hypothetical protein
MDGTRFIVLETGSTLPDAKLAGGCDPPSATMVV